MYYQQGRCWRGSYFLLSTLSNRTAHGASKGAWFLQLRGTQSSATSNSHPNPTAYWIEQNLLLAFPELAGSTGLRGDGLRTNACLQHCQWLSLPGYQGHTSPYTCVSHHTHLLENSEELKLLLVVSSSPSLLSHTQDKWRDAVWQWHCSGASLRDCYCVSVPLTAC